MKKFVVGLLLSVISATASAGLINVDTAQWSHEAGPSNDLKTGNWVGVKGQAPEKHSNSSGAFVSDFKVFGDFFFSGNFSPTSREFDDNDIVGIVFGWQDAQNHYRLGWTQTQRPGTNDDKAFSDITGRTGLFLIREVNGKSETLFNIKDLFWEDNASYSFNIKRVADQLDLNLGGNLFSVKDSTFSNGHLGVYTESQTAKFWNLKADGKTTLQPPQPIAVSEPGAIMFFSGLVLAATARRRRGLSA